MPTLTGDTPTYDYQTMTLQCADGLVLFPRMPLHTGAHELLSEVVRRMPTDATVEQAVAWIEGHGYERIEWNGHVAYGATPTATEPPPLPITDPDLAELPDDLDRMTVAALRDLAEQEGLKLGRGLSRAEIIGAIRAARAAAQEVEP